MSEEEVDYWLRLFSNNNQSFMSKDGKKITLFKVFQELKELQQENQSLKKENKILRENAEHNDKVVDKVNWENLKLKYNWNKLRETLKNEQLGSILYSDRTRFANIDEILDKMQELESSDSNDI